MYTCVCVPTYVCVHECTTVHTCGISGKCVHMQVGDCVHMCVRNWVCTRPCTLLERLLRRAVHICSLQQSAFLHTSSRQDACSPLVAPQLRELPAQSLSSQNPPGAWHKESISSRSRCSGWIPEQEAPFRGRGRKASPQGANPRAVIRFTVTVPSRLHVSPRLEAVRV